MEAVNTIYVIFRRILVSFIISTADSIQSKSIGVKILSDWWFFYRRNNCVYKHQR